MGSGEAKPLREYIETIRDIVNPKANLGFGELEYPKNVIINLCADISEIQKDIGWCPRTKFKDGIREIYEYMMENRGIQIG